jgi:hypothetical protein
MRHNQKSLLSMPETDCLVGSLTTLTGKCFLTVKKLYFPCSCSEGLFFTMQGAQSIRKTCEIGLTLSLVLTVLNFPQSSFGANS